MRSMFYKSISVVLMIAVGMMIMAAHHENESQKKQEIFDRNVATTKAWMQGMADEDLDAQMDLMADDVQHHPPHYNGNVLVNKEGIREGTQWWYDTFNDIIFHEGIGLTREKSNGFFGGSVYPQNDNPNVVAVYGTWMPIHVETGKQVFNKWHAVIEFNDAGKIIYLSDFFDFNGIQVQLEATPAEPAQPVSE
ncbi:MAG: nuclear transport factor 2 family protein [SAR202 cluster bacterium]|nr:nuclear transport factor 2 family protein [SAR202 cluster bacterium]